MKIGLVIRKKRREKDFSQEDLAQKIGVSKNNVWAWENNKYEPSGKTLLNLMEILDLEKADFITKVLNIPPTEPSSVATSVSVTE